MLKGIIHFEGEGTTPSCVEGPVEVNGDDVRFHGCSHSLLGENSVNVSGGLARFENGGRLCGLTIVAGSVNISNISGCIDGIWRHLAVGPGPVDLNIAADMHYNSIDIAGMKGQLGGSWSTEVETSIFNSTVKFNDLKVTTASAFEPLSLNKVKGSGKLQYLGIDHNYAPITDCAFEDMVYSGTVQRGSASIFNTTWTGGSYYFQSFGRMAATGLSVQYSSLHNVSVTGYVQAASYITSSTLSGKVGLKMDYHAQLQITKSHVVFLPASSTTWPTSEAGSIDVRSSTLSFPGSSGALVGASQLDVTNSTIHVTNVRDSSPIQVGGDIHMSNVNIDVTNCSTSWVSQPFIKTGQNLFDQLRPLALIHKPLFV